MFIERHLPLPEIDVGIDTDRRLVVFLSPREASEALIASVISSFVHAGKQHIDKVVSIQQVVEDMSNFVHVAFVTAALQGRYVRDPRTKIWDVTLN